jgi:L-fuconolactonase
MVPTPPRRIDAHHHFWRPARGDYRWLRPDVPALVPICRDFDPADLQPLRTAHGVLQTVLVQAADSEAETDFLLSLAEAHPSIGGVVGWVDLGRAESVATLERWAVRHPQFKGVRPMLQDLPDHDWIARAPHPEVMRTLMRLGLRFDALVQPWHLAPLQRFLEDWPALPVVIDHAAKPQLAQGWSADWAAAWRSGLAALAARPGVHCKLSGLLTEAAGPARAGGPPSVTALQPVWETLLALFGPQRLMWGSDWPVLNLAADYDRWIDVSEALIGPLTAAERDVVRCTNAMRFYGLTLPDPATP